MRAIPIKLVISLVVAFETVMVATVAAQALVTPPADDTPWLRLQTGGPNGRVTGFGFDPTGRYLYAAGWDKVVHVWERTETGFEYRADKVLRVPVGPGLVGALQALAISADGRWLAVAGRGLARSGSKQFGWVWPARGMSREMQLDRGTIYVFDLRNGGRLRMLRGHVDEVLSLAFESQGGEGRLVSASRDGTLVAWNVEEAAVEGRLDDLPLDRRTNWPPALAPWRSKPAGTLHVSFYWEPARPNAGESTIHVWNVSNGRTVSHDSDRSYHRTLLPVSPHGRILGGAQNRLAVSDHGAFPNAPRRADGLGALQGVGRTMVPEAAAFNGREVFCIATEYAGEGAPLQKLLVGRGLDGRLQSLDFTTHPVFPPRVAASSTHVAVTADDGRVIRVHAITDLLAGRSDRSQKLTGAGVQHELVAFARNPRRERGLRLRTESGVRIFNLTTGRVEADVAGWVDDRPATDDWKVRLVGDALSVVDPTTKKLVLSSASGIHQPTAVGIWPGSDSSSPLLALGSRAAAGSDEPRLSIFDLKGERELRWCLGHSAPVRKLMFSADGAFLASSADDATVRVWLMADIDRSLLGKRGLVDGLVLEDHDGGTVVQTPDSAGLLRPGDRITHVERDGERVVVESSWKLYHAVTRIAPGERLVVHVEGRSAPVALVVNQAVDAEKPRMTLFFDENGWICWDRWGRFEASDLVMERRIGWHFNTGEPHSPVRFAMIGEYRDQLRTVGLTRQLIESTDRDVKPPEPARPRMSARWLSSPDLEPLPFPTRDGDGHFLTRGETVVGVRVDDVPAALVEGVEIRLPNGWTTLERKYREDEWTTTFSPEGWTRGRERQVDLRISVGGLYPGRYVESTKVVYVPPPPRIEIVDEQSAEAEGQWVHRVRYRIHGPHPVSIRYEQWAGDEKLESAPQSRREIQTERIVTETFSLRPGTNRLTIVATNVDATESGLETTTVSTEAHVATPVVPPTIEVTAITTEDGLPRTTLRRVKDFAAEPVSATAVRLSGRIICPDPAELTLTLGDDAAQSVELDDGRFDTIVPLEVGKTVASLAAFSERGATRKMNVTLSRRPVARLEQPSRSRVDESVIALAGFVSRGTRSEEIRVWQNGELVEDAEIEIEGERLKVELPLEPGTNTCQVTIDGESDASAPVTVDYLRPPEVLEVRAPNTSREPVVAVTASVRSYETVIEENVFVTVNGEPTGSEVEVEAGPKPDVWDVRIPKLGLDGGTDVSSVEIRVRNSDGLSPEFEPRKVRVLAPPPFDVDVQFDDFPESGATVQACEQPIRFRVRSKVELESVHLLGADRFALPARQGSFAKSVKLAPGVNRFQVEVFAPSVGRKLFPPEPLLLNYVPPPVRVEVAELVWQGGSLKNTNANSPGTKAEFATPAGSGRVTIRGRVEGPCGDQSMHVKAWANGFLYETVPVRDGAFEARVVLSQARENAVKLELVGHPDEVDTGRFLVDCTAPVTEQRMHLIVVGVDVFDRKDRERVQADLAEALRIEQVEGRRWQSTRFSNVEWYRSQFGSDAYRSRINALFTQVHASIERRRRIGAPLENEVVLFFYRGEELTADRESRLATAEHLRRNRSGDVAIDVEALQRDPGAIGSGYLRDRFRTVGGAHLVFLDLVNREQEPARNIVDDPGLGILRVVNGGGELVLAELHKAAADGPAKVANVRNAVAIALKESPAAFVDDALPDELLEVMLAAP